MRQSLVDIALLAEQLGMKYLRKGKVNLQKLANDEDIGIIKGNYQTYFVGQLICKDSKFYIMLNDDLLKTSEEGRIRFTIAHEFGHFFILEHKENLANGISLSFNPTIPISQLKQYEIEASHFASHLLMPQSRFIKIANKNQIGLAGIMHLKSKFNTSIYATSKHYINLDIVSSILIKWDNNCKFEYCTYSKSFSQFTGITYRLPIKYYIEEIKDQMNASAASKTGFIEQKTNLSRWVPKIKPESDKDCDCLEQTIKLGNYGGITLLTITH